MTHRGGLGLIGGSSTPSLPGLNMTQQEMVAVCRIMDVELCGVGDPLCWRSARVHGSGVLIHPRVVLTAGHVAITGFSHGAPYVDRWGRGVLFGTGQYATRIFADESEGITISHIVEGSILDTGLSASDSGEEILSHEYNDLALLLLRDPAPSWCSPIRLGSCPAIGSQVEVSGYGGVRVPGEVPVSSSTSWATVQVTLVPDTGTSFVTRDLVGGVGRQTPGDSGGPAIVAASDRSPRVVGVVSGGSTVLVPGRTLTVYTRLDGSRLSWITSKLSEWGLSYSDFSVDSGYAGKTSRAKSSAAGPVVLATGVLGFLGWLASRGG